MPPALTLFVELSTFKFCRIPFPESTTKKRTLCDSKNAQTFALAKRQRECLVGLYLSMVQDVLSAYGIKEGARVEPFGNGLINHTWKVTASDNTYVLQKINHDVFTEPAAIAQNHRLMAGYLANVFPDYSFVAPIKATTGEELIFRSGEGWYRLLPFVPGSHSKDVVETPRQAFEAARQFGRFTKLLVGMEVSGLKMTIPDFHDLELRYRQFLQALEQGNKRRITASGDAIEALLSHAAIVDQYGAIKKDPAFRLRPTHHDTKISNVLFDAADQGICVIDLDTVMPGYFISDVGDMMRTYLSPVSEEEKDFSKIRVREAFYKAVVEGYYAEMKDELTPPEKACFFYAGQFMIYMQALRFLTDHLTGDGYYGARYEGHNLVRARNQLTLFQRLLQKKDQLEKLVLL